MLPRTIPRLDIPIFKGASLHLPIRWETEPFVYVPIASISQGAPARIVCQQPHGMVDQWRATVRGAKGMRQINAVNDPPYDGDFHRVTIINDTTLEFNDVVSLDFAAHTASTGSLQFYTPKSLAGCTARMTVRDQIGGTELLSLTTENGGIDLDDDAKVITLKFEAVDTAAYEWAIGYYDLEIEDGDGFVSKIYQGTLPVTEEETT